jgi:hypothetical protein
VHANVFIALKEEQQEYALKYLYLGGLRTKTVSARKLINE